MWNKVADFIRREQLLTRDGLHLVALSGGADSVALLTVLLRLGYRVEAVHCNFRLRGEESERDERFVESLCAACHVPLHLAHFDTRAYASLHQVSIEMAARELRYGYFRQLCQDIGAESVCVAHHRDDAVETLLMNLIRGTGIHGLTGIRPKNGVIVRPLLVVSRREIEEFLHSIGRDYVVDSTNLMDDAVRNKVRLRLIPLLQEISPKAVERIDRTAVLLREAERVFDASLQCQLQALVKRGGNSDSQSVSFAQLLRQPSPLAFLHEWLAPFGFNPTQVQRILESNADASGKEFTTPTHTLVINRGTLIVEPRQVPMEAMRIPETGHYAYADRQRFGFSFSQDVLVSKSSDCVTVDAAKVDFPLTIRPVCAGDSFIPYGMKGRKLVSDFLTDHKLSLLEKRRQLVVTDGHGQIVWLVGLRTDHRFRVTEHTTSVLRMARMVAE